ncbi:translational GTPase TypA [Pajaroellobacter abortibovis]|uniref:50S ribosomal subunit assembly factor BipA n=1 Tax=Pajaroellobacter abortibovis TaxID=1882918 RepID=A0A1L6MXA0_9BACT|nr:translational GTPase TypA [Pajaroellobacter abortibovis]APS00174.1 GTP-binding protein TypA [Pajaroellobacter abortibovis]
MATLSLRNIVIVADVDHGKTTLVDHMLRQAGTFRSTETLVDRVMDCGELERERGITIMAKNASCRWNNTKVNIIDTPGHADFGGEVERTLIMADGALLLVDAAEGPSPQTRFVLRKCLEFHFPIIVVINKIDRTDARPEEVLNEIFDLFCDLEASDKQIDFPVLYAIGKQGIAKKNLEDTSTSLAPLFESILETIPPPKGDEKQPLQVLISNLDHDDYVGRLAIGRVMAGTLKTNQAVGILKKGPPLKGAIKALLSFEGLKRTLTTEATVGEIVAISGFEDIEVGDTVVDQHPEWEKRALPRIEVEPPTLKLKIGINASPFAGKCKQSKFMTGRHLRDRLLRETRKNLALRLEETDSSDTLLLLGRGELQLAILVETMRREGYEMQLGNPQVMTKKVDSTIYEPYELAVIDVPEAFIGIVIERTGERKGRMMKMVGPRYGRARLEYRIPSRGLIGFRSELMTATRGSGLLHTLVDGWEPWAAGIIRRPWGAIVADRAGVSTSYALHHLQPRGEFFISPGVEVYEGMILGQHNRPNDTDVNVTKEKKLSNIRNHGKDENVVLSPPRLLTIETALEWIDNDELVEVTPEAIRVRKQILKANARPRRGDAEVD